MDVPPPPGPPVLLRGGTVVTMVDGAAPAQADVLLADGVVRSVHAPGAGAVPPGTDVVDASGCLVLPGLVDTHRHTWGTAWRGVASDWTLGEYLVGIRSGLGRLLEPDDMYNATLLGAVEALDGGVTTLLDWCHAAETPEHADAALQALEDSGIRAVFAFGDGSRVWSDREARLDPSQVERLLADHPSTDAAPSGDHRVSVAVCVRGPEYSSIEATADDVRAARRLGVRVTMHLGTGRVGRRVRGVAALHRAGLLGPDLTFVHANTCDDEELALVATSGGSLSVSPNVELQMGHGWPVTRRALAHGIRPSLSVDTCTSAGGDLFTGMRTALDVARGQLHAEAIEADEQVVALDVTAADALDLATVSGARTLGLGGVTGSLRAGRAADVIVVRADGLGFRPLNDPVGTLVSSGHAGLVDTVVVAGRVVKRGGRLTAVDAERVMRLAEASRDRLFARAATTPGLEGVVRGARSAVAARTL